MVVGLRRPKLRKLGKDICPLVYIDSRLLPGYALSKDRKGPEAALSIFEHMLVMHDEEAYEAALHFAPLAVFLVQYPPVMLRFSS